MSILPKLLPRTEVDKHAAVERDLIRFESRIGRNLFGRVPEGHNREFFCLDETTWVWHEDWLVNGGKRAVVSTKYYVRPEGVLKSQNGQPYKPLDATETKHFYHATKQYIKLARNEYHRMLQSQAV